MFIRIWKNWLICFLFPLVSHSQNIDIQSFSLENGLSQSSIHAFHEDNFGIVWLSTGDGINAFDGKTITKFFLSPIQNLNPAGNSFRNIISDSLGNLFVGSDKGLYFFDRSKNVILSCFSDSDKMMANASLPLFINKDTLYALIQNHGLIRFNIINHKYSLDKIQNNISHLEIFMENSNEKWTGRFPDLLIRHQLVNNKIIENHIQLNVSHLGLYITLIKLNSNQILLIYGETAFMITFSDGQTLLTDLSNRYRLFEHEGIKTGCQLENGEIWLVTESDSVLAYIDGKFERSFCFLQPQRENRKLTNITHLFKDSEHRIWVGTDGCGFAIVNPARPAFTPITKIQTSDSLIINPFIRSFTEDVWGNIWIGTYKTGLIEYQPNNHQFKTYKFGYKTEFPSLNDIYSLSVDDSVLLVGTSKGIILFNTQNQSIQYPVNQDTTASILRVSGILPFTPGKFLIHANKKVKWLLHHPDEWEYKPGPFPDSITIDQVCLKNDTVFGFTYYGIHRFISGKYDFVPFQFAGKQLQIKVNSAVPDGSGKFWIASNAGLFETTSDGNIIRNYSIENGLPSHYLYGILPDEDGNLWLSSNGGLSCFNPQTGRFRNYSTEDGLQSMEFNTGAYFMSKSGVMYFGGINGFNCISGKFANPEEKFPRLYLRNLFIQDAPANLETPVIALKSIDLPYYKNTLSFEFEAIDFCENKAHPFEYQLENHDQQWIFSGNNKLIRYSQLEPGEYHLKIRCVGEIEPGNMIHLKVIIRKPFWQELYIILPSVLLILLCFYLVVRNISTRKMKKQIAGLEQERQINQVKSRIASDLHDEIGTGLSKLAMLTDSMKMNTGVEPEVKSRLNDLSSKARQMTDQLRTIVWTLDPADDSMEGLIAYMRMKIAEFLEERHQKLSYQIVGSIPSGTVTAEFRRNVYYAVLESVHNCIKHAQATAIIISISFLKDHFMEIIIEDDGIGFDPERLHTFGHGLGGIKKRMQDLGGSFEVQSAIMKGTTLKMKIPF